MMKERIWSLCVATAMVFLCLLVVMETCQGSSGVYSMKMLHKFSDEARDIWTQKRGTSPMAWPKKGSARYYAALSQHDAQRMSKRRELIAEYQSLYFSQGNETVQYGETFGWLHYTWVDIGTPNVSFLVALDTGSDLFWVPCDCIQCAPSSASSYGLDKDLSMYRPENSSTSKHLSCSSSLCVLGHNCKTKREACPYSMSYLSDNTNSSGSLVEDVLYLASGSELASGQSVKTPVVIGCGQIQTGGFLIGGAPDGLLGLGFSDISVPSLLAKAGLVQNSFSMCFQLDDSGRIFFGDKGASNQQFTPFIIHNGTGSGYFVGVEGIHVGSNALKISGFKVLIDSGTSFTYLPSNAFKRLTEEFDEQVDYPKHFFEDVPWDYCYKVRSSDSPEMPSVSFVFKGGSNFSIYNPVVNLFSDNGTYEGFCLAVQESEYAIVAQNFMTGYRLVFDRDNLRLGWSPSDCLLLARVGYQLDEYQGNVAPAHSPENAPKSPPLQQQQNSSPRAVSPAIAGRTPNIHNSDCVQTKSNLKTSVLFTCAVTILLLGLGHTSTWNK
ncbi:aspartic proteinase-like protein 1 isoform X1 [Cryptomeria japonica]|uniref:aspartic proteinase-like protein 1 isoform X1 n=1 Tax=Cryptomeria japonica TaxID=3369 RepID=UPI0027DA1AFB|nr:aspartic proteinase-like protein 1 isoform X1 [Cryptomeria japonica]